MKTLIAFLSLIFISSLAFADENPVKHFAGTYRMVSETCQPGPCKNSTAGIFLDLKSGDNALGSSIYEVYCPTDGSQSITVSGALIDDPVDPTNIVKTGSNGEAVITMHNEEKSVGSDGTVAITKTVHIMQMATTQSGWTWINEYQDELGHTLGSSSIELVPFIPSVGVDICKALSK